MRLTTRGRFAVTAMLDLALHEQATPVSLSEISQRQSISLSYLEQLFAKLKRSGLVDSTRGPGGGYVLSKSPALISVAQIISAVDEPVDATQCGGERNCKGDNNPCITHNLWEGLNRHIMSYLENINLHELCIRPSSTEQPTHTILPSPNATLSTTANAIKHRGS
jgi:Rrf2 family transcriptional regulator, iron-sulfur cluster assembly transcription factor